MPQLRQKPNGHYYIDFHHNGARTRKELTTGAANNPQPVTDPQLAQALYADFLQAAAQQQQKNTANAALGPRIRDLCDFYLNEYLPARNAVPRTLTQVSLHLDEFKAYLIEKHLQRHAQITPRVLDGFTPWLLARRPQTKPTTLRHYIATIRAMFTAAYNRELIPTMPTRAWTMPKKTDPEHYPLTPQQLALTLHLVQRHAPDLYPVIAYMAFTGNRPSDAATLTPAQIHPDHALIRRNTVKVKRLKQFPLTPPALDLLQTALHQTPTPPPPAPPFRNATGAPWTPNAINHRIRRLQTAHTFPAPWTAKLLRHTFGSIMANAPISMPLPDLQILMGHRNIATTMQYVKATNAPEHRQRFGALMQSCHQPP